MSSSSSKKSAVVLISGSGSNLQAIIDAIKSNELQLKISAVISNTPDAKGLAKAELAKIPSICINHSDFSGRAVFEKELLNELDRYSPDYIILAGFMRILSPFFIKNIKGLVINIHPSLLPKYPGLDTHQKVLDAGEKWHGCTVHIVTEELDRGPPIIQAKVEIKQNDDAASLSRRVLLAEHKIYKKALELLINSQVIYQNSQLTFNGRILDQPLNLNQVV